VAHTRYNLVFLFNRQLTKVLLMKKYNGPYPVTYSGVGGKTEAGESAKHGANCLVQDPRCIQRSCYSACW
jgi:ADP-ribose pyrophosphatase YjhB (NUDIX family)